MMARSSSLVSGFKYTPRVLAGIGIDIAKNTAMAIPAVRNRRSLAGRTAGVMQHDEVCRLLSTYIRPVEALGIKGASVMEIGPGDNIMAGLTFLALGAKSYTAIDRFPGAYYSPAAYQWYSAMEAQIGPLPSPHDPRISIAHIPVERAKSFGKYDIVCSHAVGEHVTNVAEFAAFTKRSLAPTGKSLHVVDFSGHHWHREDDPDLFRHFPDWLWRAMGSNRGLPNRVSPAAFIDTFERQGLVVSTTLNGTHAEIYSTKEGVS